MNFKAAAVALAPPTLSLQSDLQQELVLQDPLNRLEEQVRDLQALPQTLLQFLEDP